MKNSKIAMITGATSGIGMATARYFAQNDISLVICGRRVERLENLKKELLKHVQVHTLSFDVRSKEEVINAIESLPAPFNSIDILVNNAGNAHGLDPVETGNLDDWDAMIDINVKGLMYVTNAIVPIMIQRKTGHIINIGSIAGKEVYPNGNVYCASKHAVDAFTRGMRMDLVKYGIKVSEVNPGLVETEFSLVRFKGDKQRSDAVYRGYEPLHADDIADLIYYIVSRPTHVNIGDVIIFPAAQASSSVLIKKS